MLSISQKSRRQEVASKATAGACVVCILFSSWLSVRAFHVLWQESLLHYAQQSISLTDVPSSRRSDQHLHVVITLPAAKLVCPSRVQFGASRVAAHPLLVHLCSSGIPTRLRAILYSPARIVQLCHCFATGHTGDGDFAHPHCAHVGNLRASSSHYDVKIGHKWAMGRLGGGLRIRLLRG